MTRLLLTATLKAGGIGFWTYDTVTGLVEVDDTLRELLGVQTALVSQLRPDDLVATLHPEDQSSFRQAMAEALGKGGVYKVETRVPRAVGGPVWLEVRGQVVVDPETKTAVLHGVTLDITERKVTEARLRRQTQSLQELATAALAIGASLSAEAVLQTGCEQAARIVGVGDATAMMLGSGGNWSQQIVFSSHHEQPAQKAAHLASSGCFGVVCRQNRTLCLNAAELQGELPGATGFLATPLLDRGGATLGLIALVNKAGAAFTSDDAAVLVQIARITSVAIENARLYLELREADRRKDEFLAVLSHELRSPLNVISGHTELLKLEEPGSQDFLQSLDVIERNTKVQTQLISDLLDVSRIITGKLKLNISTFAVLPVIESALDAVRFAANSRGVKLVLDAPPELGVMTGEATRIQQVLWNLLSNAVKFTPEGGQVDLHVRLSKGAVEFRVQDTGLGISEDFLPHVFDRFQQEDASKTRKYGGLGLGLAIVRHITEQHGGWVWVESEGRGKGATFTVTLPLRGAHAGEGAGDDEARSGVRAKARQRPPQQPVEQPLSDVTVLLTDDQADARELGRKILTRAGAAVVTASSAEAALTLLEEQRFAVIICDVGMPDVNGYDFIERWRRQERARGLRPTPAVALTAFASDSDRSAAIAAGYQVHLAKPVRMKDLVSVVARLSSEASPA